MGRKKDKVFVQKPATVVRQEVRATIALRQNPQTRWKFLEQAVKSEDKRRKEFYDKITEKTSVIPLTIEKFIRTLKSSVRLTMRHVGGTPFSIIRHMFLHWDSAKKGALSEPDLHRCLLSLGVKTTKDERDNIIEYYSVKRNPKGVDAATINALVEKGDDMISYHLLLNDILRGEPTVIEFVHENHEEELLLDKSRRFAVAADAFSHKPKLVQDFLEALQCTVSQKLAVDGGTPFSVIRAAFNHYDHNYNCHLDKYEFIKAMKSLNVNLSVHDSEHIIAFYDRSGTGELDYQVMLRDICQGMDSIVAHKELTATDRDAITQTIKTNQFLNDHFAAAPSKVLHQFITNARISLNKKVALSGGSVESWARDAFHSWDPLFSGKVARWEYMQGAAKRLGMKITDDEAKSIMVSYDREGVGEMKYEDLIADIVKGEGNFLSTERTGQALAQTQDMYSSTLSDMSKYIPGGGGGDFTTTSYYKTTSKHLRPQSAPVNYRVADLFSDSPRPNTGTSEGTFEFPKLSDTDVQMTNQNGGKPSEVVVVMQKIKVAGDAFSRKSKGQLAAKDVLLGTMLRFDPSSSGRIGARDLKEVCRALKVKSVSEDELVSLIRWFDTNGSNCLDYHSLLAELHGDDIIMRRNNLPTPQLTAVAKRDNQPLPLERHTSCALIKDGHLSKSTSTAFDFASKDPFWSSQYEAQANETLRISRQKLKYNRPKSACPLPARKAFLDTAYKPAKKLPPSKSNASILRMNEAAATVLDYSGSASGTLNGNTNGVVPDRLVDANGKVIHPDTKAYKALRRALCFRQMEGERSRVVQKLDEVERQRKALSEDLKTRQAAKAKARELKETGKEKELDLTLDLGSTTVPSPTTHSP